MYYLLIIFYPQLIKMVDNQAGGGNPSSGGGTSTPTPSCAGVDMFERMIKMSSEFQLLGNR